MKLKVDVTTEHISKGSRSAPTSCPISLVLADMGFSNYVWDYEIEIESTGGKYSMPTNAIGFIQDFDAEFPVDPFSFELDMPDWEEHTHDKASPFPSA